MGERVPNAANENFVHYVTHQAAIRESSTTTKGVCVAFIASYHNRRVRSLTID